MKASKKLVKKYLPKIIGLRLNSLFLIKPEKAVFKAYELFSSPRKGQIKPEQEIFLNKAKTTSIEYNSNKIQTYHWKGEGKTVILIHGWDSNTHRWKDLINDLQKENYNIIAFDAPAHGYSEGKLLNVLMYSKCLNRMLKLYRPEFVIGHSVGAMAIVYNQYLKQSSFVEKLVLLGAPSEMSAIMSDYKRILRLSDKFMRALEAYFKEKFDYNFSEFSIAGFAKNIEKEALIIHDEFDRVASVEAAKAIHKNLKHSRLKITEGAGHSLNKDEIRKEILNFLNQ
ncbi:alpha/beta hydrolase [Psychroflexus sp. CAK57W]|uniref:alpha/beta fold hydrolase n=1 Tax=Psychroflexus curvus TaxID=2873595 RepID=UPI001CCE9470|nr:alpha/beta hydrolase [Psychroflexus curvus]MBZ9787697.1 alpha/beta hydrolase [Psychroflexus curvus]